MRYFLASTLFASTALAATVRLDFGPEYGFRYDKYSVTDSTTANSDKIKYYDLFAVTTGGSLLLTAEESLYLGVRGSYATAAGKPKAKIFHNGLLSDEGIRMNRKYAIEADGVMGYQFYLNGGTVLLCPQIGYGYSKYKLTDQLIAPSIQSTSMGAFVAANGAPYAGLKTIWLLKNSMNVHMTVDYFYVAFRHETPVLDSSTVRTTFRMSTLQGPRFELKFEKEFANSWFLNAGLRGRYLFAPKQKVLLLYGNNSENLRSHWLTLESLVSFGYTF